MKLKGTILIIDDDPEVRLSICMLLEPVFENILSISNPSEIIDVFNRNKVDVVLLDMNFKNGDTSGKEGIYWLELIKKISKTSSVIMITAYTDINTAVKSLKQGAFDFLAKPWENKNLIAAVKAGLKFNQEKGRAGTALGKKDAQSKDDMIWGGSSEMEKLKAMSNKVALTDAHILINGENGTGKEVLAKYIHLHSMRKNEVFLGVDLGALTSTLFESELFGHVKGAFTDAKEDKKGRFLAANGGTVFLDEIGNLDLAQQVKLLSVLQSSEVTPLGTHRPQKTDVRVICATNADLHQMVKVGRFREDLYYRINTIEINIPPLRQRVKDIRPLTDHFLQWYNKRYNKNIYLPAETLNVLETYHWPGNIRELQHVIERGVILTEGEKLTVSDLRLNHNETKYAFEDFNLDKIEKWAIIQAIEKHDGNVSHAAKELGLSRGALYRRIEKYDISINK